MDTRGLCCCHRRQSHGCCMQHWQAWRKQISAKGSALPVPACLCSARTMAGCRAGISTVGSEEQAPQHVHLRVLVWLHGADISSPSHGILLYSCRNPLPLWQCLRTPQPLQNHNPGEVHLTSPLPCARGALRHGAGLREGWQWCKKSRRGA